MGLLYYCLKFIKILTIIKRQYLVTPFKDAAHDILHKSYYLGLTEIGYLLIW